MQSVPTPVQSPIELAWIGASSEPTARLAGKLGFGLQLPRGRTAESYVPIIDAYREAWTGAGYPGDQSRVSIARCLYVGESDHEALASMEPATRMFAQRWQPNLAKDLTMRDLVDQMNFCVGGPDSVIQHVQHLQQVTGFTHLSIQPTWDSVPQAAALASLRRFARDVRPNLSLLV
jgi:alkanesulfonate monooxygenase SsuD/methylene tetrahydromethanopterin reductase-like flavin-dependent oxidoreductase (luciferase family)